MACASPHPHVQTCRRLAWAALLCAVLCTGAGAEPSDAERSAFQKYNSCPSTGRRSGECPGYRIAYRVAPCVGGQDRWTNMQWLSEPAARDKVRSDAAACAARVKK
jgi:hypothetical protein